MRNNNTEILVSCPECGTRIARGPIANVLPMGGEIPLVCGACHTSIRMFGVLSDTYPIVAVNHKKYKEHWVGVCPACHDYTELGDASLPLSPRTNEEGRMRVKCRRCGDTYYAYVVDSTSAMERRLRAFSVLDNAMPASPALAAPSHKVTKGKPNLSLLFTSFLVEMVKVREHGALTYDNMDSWTEVDDLDWLDAIERHARRSIDIIQESRTARDAPVLREALKDEDSLAHHMAHIAVSAMYVFSNTASPEIKKNPWKCFKEWWEARNAK